MKRLLIGGLLAAASVAGVRAEPPGSPDLDPRWMPPSQQAATVPQIAIPLRPAGAGRPHATTRARTPTGGVDDGAARCVAQRDAWDRAECERGRAQDGPARGR